MLSGEYSCGDSVTSLLGEWITHTGVRHNPTPMYNSNLYYFSRNLSFLLSSRWLPLFTLTAVGTSMWYHVTCALIGMSSFRRTCGCIHRLILTASLILSLHVGKHAQKWKRNGATSFDRGPFTTTCFSKPSPDIAMLLSPPTSPCPTLSAHADAIFCRILPEVLSWSSNSQYITGG